MGKKGKGTGSFGEYQRRCQEKAERTCSALLSSLLSISTTLDDARDGRRRFEETRKASSRSHLRLILALPRHVSRGLRDLSTSYNVMARRGGCLLPRTRRSGGGGERFWSSRPLLLLFALSAWIELRGSKSKLCSPPCSARLASSAVGDRGLLYTGKETSKSRRGVKICP